MWEELDERALCLAEYIVRTGCTVRACAAYFSVSKSTVHKDMTERLPQIDKILFKEVRAILARNLRERHLRGGDATKKKYELKRRAAALRCKSASGEKTEKVCANFSLPDKILQDASFFSAGKPYTE